MTTLEQALREVLEAPRENGPRLRYAEAVKDSDPARAELIRLQIKEASAPGPDYGLRDKIDALLRANRARWVADVTPLVHLCDLRRGFVEYVDVDAKKYLQVADALRRMAPILDLRLTGSKAVAAELFGSAHLSGIRALDQFQQSLGDDEVKLLARSPWLSGLRWLDLTYNRVGDAGVEALAASKTLGALQWVGLEGNPAEDPTPQVITDEYDRVHGVERKPSNARLIARHGPLPWLVREYAVRPQMSAV